MSIMCFLFQNQYARLQKTAKRSEINWNQANIESTLKMCREGKSIRASEKPVECQRQHCKIGLKCKKKGYIYGVWKKNRD